MRLWLKLDSGYYLDPKLRKAGADARLCWAPILALMKQHGGLIPDDELDSEYLADQVGGAVEMWKRAISRLKDLDLLVITTQSRHRGRGVYADVSGWTAPNWIKFQAPAGEKQPTETTRNTVQRRSTTLNGVKRIETALNALSREKRIEEKIKNPLKAPKGPLAWTDDHREIWQTYRRWHPRSKDRPSKAWHRMISAAIKEHSAEDVCCVILWVKQSHDTKAVYLRENGHDKLDNILRPSKLPGRVETATAGANGADDVLEPGTIAYEHEETIRALVERAAE